MKISALILSAEKTELSDRDRPAAFSALCGKPVIDYVSDTLASLTGGNTFVVNYNPEERTALCAQERLQDSGAVLIVPDNLPFLHEDTLREMIQSIENGAECVVLGAKASEPDGIISDFDTPVCCFHSSGLLAALNGPETRFADIAARFIRNGSAKILKAQDECELFRVEDLADLAEAETTMRRQINNRLMRSGVRIIAPETTYIHSGVKIGRGTVVYPGCYLEGNTVIAENVTLLPNCHLVDAQIGTGTQVESSVILQASVGEHTTVGPNAYIRPNSKIGSHCRVGDFVEIKNAVIGDGTKISHLTYVGDADLGKEINLGCGVVFVNYDGKNKYRSSIGDHAFIGCNCNLVAPVHVGDDAYIAAGSTVTQDVESGALCIARSRQTVKTGWVAKRREKGLLK